MISSSNLKKDASMFASKSEVFLASDGILAQSLKVFRAAAIVSFRLFTPMFSAKASSRLSVRK